MAKTETIYLRVEPQTKKQAESTLAKLGLTTSDAVNIFLNQVILTRGLPFEVKMPALTREEAEEILMKQLDDAEASFNEGRWLTIEESKQRMNSSKKV